MMRMKQAAMVMALILMAGAARAGVDRDPVFHVSDDDMMTLIQTLTDQQIVPGYQAFSGATARLSETAAAACGDGLLGPQDRAAVQGATAAAFQAWQAVQHYRFGPVMEEDRFHRIQYWPDPKSLGARHLKALLTEAEPAALQPGGLASASIAVQGFPALERLLWEDLTDGTPERRCQVIAAIAANLRDVAAATVAGWTTPSGHRAVLLGAEQGNQTYRAPVEALKTLHGSLSTLLQFAGDMKIGGPLGSGPDRARPERGEGWRSGQTLDALRANVAAARRAYEGLMGATGGATGKAGLSIRALVRRHPEAEEVDAAITHGLKEAERLLAGLGSDWKAVLATPDGYRELALVRSNLSAVRAAVESDVAGILGIGIGFNALDGD